MKASNCIFMDTMRHGKKWENLKVSLNSDEASHSWRQINTDPTDVQLSSSGCTETTNMTFKKQLTVLNNMSPKLKYISNISWLNWIKHIYWIVIFHSTFCIIILEYPSFNSGFLRYVVCSVHRFKVLITSRLFVKQIKDFGIITKHNMMQKFLRSDLKWDTNHDHQQKEGDCL